MHKGVAPLIADKAADTLRQMKRHDAEEENAKESDVNAVKTALELILRIEDKAHILDNPDFEW